MIELGSTWEAVGIWSGTGWSLSGFGREVSGFGRETLGNTTGEASLVTQRVAGGSRSHLWYTNTTGAACLTRGESMGSSNWAIGDSVVVKPGVTDPVTSSA